MTPQPPCPPIPPSPPEPAGAPLRVVLVEDDPMVRQLLTMVWDDYGLELRSFTRVPPAVAALREAQADLIVTDLMLPGESGLDLLARLAAEPALRGSARVAVFSAGIDAAMLARLQAFDVWRVLRKPLPIGELQQCVEDAGARLRPAPASAAAPAGGDPTASTTASATASPTAPALAPTADEWRAIDTHFGGNQALFMAFRDAARQQFGRDLADGDTALQRTDAPALRRLAHTLKSVLGSLGHGAFSQLAAALEASAAQADWSAARPQWAALRRALAELGRDD